MTLHGHVPNPQRPERLRKDLHHAESKTVATHQLLEVTPRQGQALALFGRPRSGEPWSIVQESHLPEHVPDPAHGQFFFSSSGNLFYDLDGPLRHDVELVGRVSLLEQPITGTRSNSLHEFDHRAEFIGRKTHEETRPTQGLDCLVR